MMTIAEFLAAFERNLHTQTNSKVQDEAAPKHLSEG